MTTFISFQQINSVGLITLKRPQALNAMTTEMCIAMYEQLQAWMQQDAIAMVIIRGESEKAFCAGGDIRHFYDNSQENWQRSQQFFWHEYRLNHCIHSYPKPFVSLCHGITMGGGVGVSLHASHRVAAPNLKWAMPETGIGFFPDIGSCYVLRHQPLSLARYIALTGNVLSAADASYMKLIN